MKLSHSVQIINLFGALLFLVFAWFQRNDVDPEIYYRPSGMDAALWLLFYLLIAILMVAVIWKKIPLWLLALAALACIIEMVRTGPGLYQNLFGDESFSMTQTSMSAEDPRVELSREFFGAVISLIGVAWVWIQYRLIKPTSAG